MKNKQFLILILLTHALGLAGIVIALLFLQSFLLPPLFSLEALLPALTGTGVGIALAALITLLTKYLKCFRDSRALKAIRVLKNLNWLQIVVLALSAGFAEELLFRGALQPLWGILISSVIFALLHAVSKLYISVAFIISLCLGLLLQWTSNLAAPIMAHAAYDFSILALLRLGYFDFVFAGDAVMAESTRPEANNKDISDL